MFPKIPHPPHTKIAWPRERLAAIDFIDEASRQNTVYGMLEFDVTTPLALVREHEVRTGEKLSFTSYIIRCVAKAVEEQKRIAAYREKDKGLVVFEDVDVSTLIERKFDGGHHPTLYYVRNANQKSFIEIHRELRESQDRKVDEKTLTEEKTTSFLRMPRFIRKWMLRAMRRDPFIKKFATGTVGVTSVGMLAPSNRRSWILPVSPYTLMIGIGAFYKAPAVVDDRIEAREMVALTVCVDHDVVDGGPAARFTTRFGQLIEAGFELPGGPEEVQTDT
ncbi:MAG: 2-oxo acid dehydrogenase subunit E2 [Pirellulaceae bacterium]|jgi:pyruvate/2-oxoglutarate dehydrogenase complex dihydrolipoamide acyltransferase (E2) component|nr:2-oxo acid dehydrogenase subunit E2 [Pirellulaceae bacterium]MDP6553895.1 2-oxo acid dehydrogenase subunit E2 [Pirellulaceae bacterium]